VEAGGRLPALVLPRFSRRWSGFGGLSGSFVPIQSQLRVVALESLRSLFYRWGDVRREVASAREVGAEHRGCGAAVPQRLCPRRVLMAGPAENPPSCVPGSPVHKGFRQPDRSSERRLQAEVSSAPRCLRPWR